MNKKLLKQIKVWNKAQDVFAHTKHEERKLERLKWKDVDLDAPTIEQAKYWEDLQSPFKLKNDRAIPSGYANDVSFPDYKNIQHTKNN